VTERKEPDPLAEALRAAKAAIEDLDPSAPTDPAALVAALSAARDRLDEALDEAMATAALHGASMRKVAQAAMLAPNTLPPRLARTASLADYADEGKVTSGSLERARHDRRRGTYEPAPNPPEALRFRRRT
jgi:hypothetical protein